MSRGSVCPWWLGYALVCPLRRWLADPRPLLAPHVAEGALVLEPGCGMGFYTLDLARLVGPGGRVVAIDLQRKMLDGLARRAARAGLAARIETRLAGAESLGADDLAGQVDVAFVLQMLHEVPDQAAFLAEVKRALKPGGRLVLVEPRGHVSREDFERSLACARALGFADGPAPRASRMHGATFLNA